MRHEAETLVYLAERGYPVPEVHEVSDDGLELVMERIDGPTMVEAIGRAPWTLHHHAHSLAELHLRLHELESPPTFPASRIGTGDRLLHMDLHPLNVLIGSKGPVVIDWGNASRGDPAVDVCVAWVLMTAGEIPGNRVKTTAMGLVRSLLVRSFLSRFDRASLAPTLREVVEWKAADPHMRPSEQATMRRLADRVAPRRGRDPGSAPPP